MFVRACSRKRPDRSGNDRSAACLSQPCLGAIVRCSRHAKGLDAVALPATASEITPSESGRDARGPEEVESAPSPRRVTLEQAQSILCGQIGLQCVGRDLQSFH